jgi:hypothetical protein
MTDPLKKRKKTRSGHRAFVAKILPEAKQIAVEFQPEQEAKAMQLRSALNEQLLLLEPLDKEILSLMEDDDATDEEAMATEVEKSFMLKSDMKTTIAMIEELCRKATAGANTNVHENPDVETAQPNTPVESIVD